VLSALNFLSLDPGSMLQTEVCLVRFERCFFGDNVIAQSSLNGKGAGGLVLAQQA